MSSEYLIAGVVSAPVQSFVSNVNRTGDRTVLCGEPVEGVVSAPVQSFVSNVNTTGNRTVLCGEPVEVEREEETAA